MRALWKVSIIAVIAILLGVSGGDVTAKDKEKDEDSFKLLRTAGRTWLLKRVPKAGNEGGDTSTTYHKFEVKNAWEDKAELSQSTLDSAKKPTSQEDFVIEIEFDLEELFFKDPIGFKKNKIEKVRTDAGTFECIKWVRNSGDDGNVSLWRSVDFPGLIVKQDSRFGTRELVEFTWVPGDPGHEEDKDDDEEEPEPRKLFKTKRAEWIHKTVTEKGPRRVKSFDVKKYEVKDTGDEEAELEVTQLTQLLRKEKGTDEETVVVKFDDTFEDKWLKPDEYATKDREERRIVEAGLFVCIVYSYRDDDGRDVYAWYAKDWPGLLVRKVVEDDSDDERDFYRAVTELIEFEE